MNCYWFWKLVLQFLVRQLETYFGILRWCRSQEASFMKFMPLAAQFGSFMISLISDNWFIDFDKSYYKFHWNNWRNTLEILRQCRSQEANLMELVLIVAQFNRLFEMFNKLIICWYFLEKANYCNLTMSSKNGRFM